MSTITHGPRPARSHATGARELHDYPHRTRFVLTREQRRNKDRTRGLLRRTVRADRIGYAALLGRTEPTWATRGIYLAQDDAGSICAPDPLYRAYGRFRWWKPLHAAAWINTAITGRMLAVSYR